MQSRTIYQLLNATERMYPSQPWHFFAMVAFFQPHTSVLAFCPTKQPALPCDAFAGQQPE